MLVFLQGIYTEGNPGTFRNCHGNAGHRGTVRAGHVNNSAKTNSNDGLNCLTASTPFPPCPPTPTNGASTD